MRLRTRPRARLPLGIMVDRMSQYSMYPQSIMQNSVQQSTQQQMPQQPQQQQQSDPQMIQGLSNTDPRMWQMQMQNSYRAQQPGDLAPPQLNQQASVKYSPSPPPSGPVCLASHPCCAMRIP